MIPFYESYSEKLRMFYNKSRFEYPVHLQTSIEFIYVDSGPFSISIGKEDYLLSTGSLCIVFPNQMHGFNRPPGDNTKSFVICCEPELLPDFSQYFFKFTPGKPVLSLEELHPDVLYALKRLMEDRHTVQSISISKAFLQLILSHTIPKLNLEPVATDLAPGLTERLLNYIAVHFQEPLSLDILSRALGASKFQISRIFSKTLQISFNEYINLIRLDYASKLIRTTDYTMTYICLESGFTNQHTFNRVFRQYYHMTPNEYRHM